MIRERHGKHSESCVAACDKCGAECEGSRQYGTGQWDSGLATAHAKVSCGWKESIEGRMLRLVCPKCCKTLGLTALLLACLFAGCRTPEVVKVEASGPYPEVAVNITVWR
jgi:hypothetical protein